jgi:uncharacterized protein
MALVRILVDGYSLLHGWPELAPGRPRHTALAREELIRVLTQYQDAVGTPVTVVFDGGGAPPGTPKTPEGQGIEVLYSGRGKTADDLIERATVRLLRYGDVLVVTDDFAERDTVISFGGSAWSCASFIRSLEAERDGFDRDVHHHNRREVAAYRRAPRS